MKPTSATGHQPPKPPKPADPESLSQSNQKADALKQQARDLARSAEMLCQEMLAHSNERIEVLEKQARDLACFVETARQQSRSQSDKKIEALEQKARDLADFVETLRNQTRLQFEKEIEALTQKARDLAASVETDHEKTVAMNEALLLGSVRQHELTEVAENLNAQLRAEIATRKQVEGELRLAQAELAALALELEALVTQRTAALRETVGELEAFSYSIAHDMRAPLRAMTGFARLVQTEHGEQLDETGKGHLGRIISAAQRLDHLITDVLSYSSAGRRKLDMQPVDLEKLLEEAIHNLPELQPPRAEIEIRTPLPRVTAHEPSLMQCATNLLANAVKFVSPGVVPKVTVRSELVGQDVRLWFEDNGIGISAAGKERIFSLFGRLNPAADFEGTGIGLAIVRKSVERMGGKFGVESEPGRGSRFWIQLKKSQDI
jgi:signal transduction histidine kinase